MAEADTESAAEADTDEEQEITAWASQTPTTRISGTPKRLIFAGELSERVREPDNSFGVVLADPSVEVGTLFVNDEKPDGATTAEGVEDAPRPTDYRIVDVEDQDTTIANGALVTDENGPNTYTEGDEFAEGEIIVWYNGLTGQRIARLLDFNGQPYARWTDEDSYLVKGLYQSANGWREARRDERGELAQNGKAPRVARAPILRQRTETIVEDGDEVGENLLDEPIDQRILIDMSRPQSGRGYRLHAFDADAFEDEFGSLDADVPRNDSGYVSDDIESEIEWRYTPFADSVLTQAEYRMHMYTGSGWPDEPADWQPENSSEVSSFGIGSDDGGADTNENGLTAEEQQFAEEVVEELAGKGMTPDEAFQGGLNGLVGKYQDQFSSAPDVDAIERAVYAEVSHLDTDELEE